MFELGRVVFAAHLLERKVANLWVDLSAEPAVLTPKMGLPPWNEIISKLTATVETESRCHDQLWPNRPIMARKFSPPVQLLVERRFTTYYAPCTFRAVAAGREGRIGRAAASASAGPVSSTRPAPVARDAAAGLLHRAQELGVVASAGLAALLELQRTCGNRSAQRLLTPQAGVQRAVLDEVDVHTCPLPVLVQQVLDESRDTQLRVLDLRVLLYRDSNFSSLTPGEKYKMINLVLDNPARGMGARLLRELWGSFGDDPDDEPDTGLARRAALNFDLFDRSVKAGAKLGDLPGFNGLRARFRSDVSAVVRRFLDENENIALGEREKFGYTTPNNQFKPRNADWRGETERLHADAVRVKQTQEAMKRLRATPVGYFPIVELGESAPELLRENLPKPRLPVRFDPKGPPPQFPLRGDEGLGTASWEDLSARHKELETALLDFATANPTVYLLIQQGKLDDVTKLEPGDATQQEWIRSEAGDALDKALLSIRKTRQRLDGDDIQFDAFEPVHEQLIAGRLPEAGSFWADPLHKWVANTVLADARSAKAWEKLQVSIGTGIAFCVASMSGIGLVGFAIAAGAGVAGTAHQLAGGWSEWRSKQDAASADVEAKLEMVRQHQADDAAWDLMLDAAFAALDAYGAANDLRRVMGAFLPARAAAQASTKTAEALVGLRSLEPAAAQAVIERGVVELGIQAVKKHSGLEVADLIKQLEGSSNGASSALPALRRHQSTETMKALGSLPPDVRDAIFRTRPTESVKAVEDAVTRLGVEGMLHHTGMGLDELVAILDTASSGKSPALAALLLRKTELALGTLRFMSSPEEARRLLDAAVTQIGPRRTLELAGLQPDELIDLYNQPGVVPSAALKQLLRQDALQKILVDDLGSISGSRFSPEVAASIIERSVTELGVEATIRHSGMSGGELAELVQKSRPDSPVLLTLKEPADAHRVGQAALSETVLEVYDRSGPMAAIRQFGGWTELSKKLGEGTPAGDRLLAWRDTVLAEEFQRYVADIGGRAMRTGNVGKMSNDFDWIFLGPNANETRDTALSWLMKRTDASSLDETRRLLHGEAFSDPRRLHRYDSLPPELRQSALEQQTKVEQEQIFARLISKAGETPDNPGYYTRLRDELGIAPAKLEPLSAERRVMLEKDIEQLERSLSSLSDAEKAPVMLEIGQKQGLLNASNPEAYTTGGSGRLWVSERKGHEVPGFKPGDNPPAVAAEMHWAAALDELPFLQDSVVAIRRSTEAGDIADAMRLLAKHGERLGAVAVKALKTESENWARFELLGSRFTLLLERARSAGPGSLASELTRDFAKVRAEADQLIWLLEHRTLDLLKEMKQHVKISGAGFDELQQLVTLQLQQREMTELLKKALVTSLNLTDKGRHVYDWAKTPEAIKEPAAAAEH